MSLPIKTYVNKLRTQQIDIYADHKNRFGFFEKDEWPTLQRATVPHLTDAEWYSAPISDEGWEEAFA